MNSTQKQVDYLDFLSSASCFDNTVPPFEPDMQAKL